MNYADIINLVIGTSIILSSLFGIKHFPNFRRPALLMDDFYYGRKPKSKKMLAWLDI